MHHRVRSGLRIRRGVATSAMSLTLVIATACLVAGCSSSRIVTGTATKATIDPNMSGTMAVADGRSGVRDDAPKPTGTVIGSDDGDDDELALLAVNDVAEFWENDHWDPSWKGSFEPVEKLYSYDPRDASASPVICSRKTYHTSPNAFWCPPRGGGPLIAWDRGGLLPGGRKYFGDMSIPGVLAHEYGHHIQFSAGLVDSDTNVIVREQQADCFGGVYLRWVAEGHSKRFQLSTGDDLSRVIAGLVDLSDTPLTPEEQQEYSERIGRPFNEELDGHGSALDRVSAFQMGFDGDVATCAAINQDEIDSRRKGLPILLPDAIDDPNKGNAPVTEDLVNLVMTVSESIYSPKEAPRLSFDKADCSDAKPSEPASYCPATNTVFVDLPELQKIGTPAGEEEEKLIQGDNTAISLVMSRYVLSLQKERGDKLDTAETGLRTACLTGYGQRQMADPKRELTLSAGDLDEAVAGLLTNGLVASDVNGDKVPSGFSRISAFRVGVQTDDIQACYDQFR